MDFQTLYYEKEENNNVKHGNITILLFTILFSNNKLETHCLTKYPLRANIQELPERTAKKSE